MAVYKNPSQSYGATSPYAVWVSVDWVLLCVAFDRWLTVVQCSAVQVLCVWQRCVVRRANISITRRERNRCCVTWSWLHGDDARAGRRCLIIWSPPRKVSPGKNPPRPAAAWAERIFTDKLSAGEDFSAKRSYNGKTLYGAGDILIRGDISIPWSSLPGLSLIHIWRCRRSYACRSRWSPYH